MKIVDPAKQAAAEEYEVFLNDLRGHIKNSVRDLGINWSRVAELTFLSKATVANFADGTTKRPHHFTITQIQKLVESRRRRKPPVLPQREVEVRTRPRPVRLKRRHTRAAMRQLRA